MAYRPDKLALWPYGSYTAYRLPKANALRPTVGYTANRHYVPIGSLTSLRSCDVSEIKLLLFHGLYVRPTGWPVVSHYVAIG